AGRCAVGIVNSYYLGRAQRDQPQLSVAPFWPNQGDGERGVHVNVSGAGVVAHAGNPLGARAFIEWLAASEAPGPFGSENLEFPANPNVPAAPSVQAWGGFRQDLINVSEAGKLQAE